MTTADTDDDTTEPADIEPADDDPDNEPETAEPMSDREFWDHHGHLDTCRVAVFDTDDETCSCSADSPALELPDTLAEPDLAATFHPDDDTPIWNQTRTDLADTLPEIHTELEEATAHE